MKIEKSTKKFGIFAAILLVWALVFSNMSFGQDKNSGTDLTISVNDVPFVMKFVEGGTFWMGAQSTNPNEQNYDPQATSIESPVHSVTLDDYYMSETEVTQALWVAVMGEKPKDNAAWHKNFGIGKNHPAYNVRWTDCQEFILKLNQMTGKNFRMPTEAEWEYAARGGNKSKGYRYAGSDDIDKVAWYVRNSGDKYLKGSPQDNPFFYEEKVIPNHNRPHLVKSKAPNELGLYDMSGNVAEWCSDYFGLKYYLESPSYNPQGPDKLKNDDKDWHSIRGEDYDEFPENYRLSARHSGQSNHISQGIGLRLVLSLID